MLVQRPRCLVEQFSSGDGKATEKRDRGDWSFISRHSDIIHAPGGHVKAPGSPPRKRGGRASGWGATGPASHLGGASPKRKPPPSQRGGAGRLTGATLTGQMTLHGCGRTSSRINVAPVPPTAEPTSERPKGAPHSVHHTEFCASADKPAKRLWARLGVAREALAGGAHDRQAKCLHVRIAGPETNGAGIRRDQRGRVWVTGVVRCGHWTCPACGVARARRAAAELSTAISRHLSAGLYADAWMLTLTVPHYGGDLARDTVEVLYSAYAAFIRGSTFRAFARRFGVRAKVRALDVTFGSSGAHPHFHVALLVDRAAVTLWQPARGLDAESRALWLREQQVELAEAWADSVIGAGRLAKGGRESMVKVGCHLAPGEKVGGYLAGWGLEDEVTGAPLKSRSHLALLDEGDGHMFRVWRDAVDGRQWLTGMADALKALGITEDDIAARLQSDDASDGTSTTEVAEISISIPPYFWGAALRAGLGVLVDIVRESHNEDDARRAIWKILSPFNQSGDPRDTTHTTQQDLRL